MSLDFPCIIKKGYMVYSIEDIYCFYVGYRIFGTRVIIENNTFTLSQQFHLRPRVNKKISILLKNNKFSFFSRTKCMSIKLQNKQENMDVKADVLQMLKKNKK